MKHYTSVLTIAGSDSGGGAGIQADIKTISACGCYATTAITAVTVQNSVGVRAVHDVPADIVRGQIEAVLEDIGADAVKIGMLKSKDIVREVCHALRPYALRNIVLDPVMVSTSGHRLMNKDAEETLQKELFPLAEVITPNVPEAENLTGIQITDAASMEKAAHMLYEKFHVSVLLKGGHCINDANDLIYTDEHGIWMRGERIDNPNTHGTGCTLSSAIASNLARGFSLEESVRRSKQYLTEALRSQMNLGHGSGPLDHTLGRIK